MVSVAYDLVRTGDREMVGTLIRGSNLSSESVVLDVGCGTTNNTLLLQTATKARIVGIDLSLGMLRQACSKSLMIQLVQSIADRLPFHESVFDLAFMTEVIHHLHDFRSALTEMHGLLVNNGCACIVTQSHKQIEERMTSRFFPSTVKVDCARYPSIVSIEDVLKSVGFTQTRVESCQFTPVRLGQDYLETVEKRGYSMLHKISDLDYECGLDDLRQAISEGENLSYSAGYTFVWAWK